MEWDAKYLKTYQRRPSEKNVKEPSLLNILKTDRTDNYNDKIMARL